VTALSLILPLAPLWLGVANFSCCSAGLLTMGSRLTWVSSSTWCCSCWPKHPWSHPVLQTFHMHRQAVRLLHWGAIHSDSCHRGSALGSCAHCTRCHHPPAWASPLSFHPAPLSPAGLYLKKVLGYPADTASQLVSLPSLLSTLPAPHGSPRISSGSALDWAPHVQLQTAI
jgi:hypothetical protein